MIFAQAPQSFRNRNVLERELLFGHGPGGEKNIDSMYTREFFPVYTYQYRNPKSVDPVALKPKTFARASPASWLDFLLPFKV